METVARALNTYNSYFVYDKYAFVGQFYDSNRWHALEAHWTFMRRLDVANCFRSIYTHSVAWSTGTDFFSKENLGEKNPEDLGRQLDSAMQRANWGETHGILIGPEISRIFAEIVFQKMAAEMEARIQRNGIKRGQYEILRYVDDYFVFASDEQTIVDVSSVVESVLSEHRYSMNPAKTRDYSTPFTTNISVKKAHLKSFLLTALPPEGDLPALDSRNIAVQLKSLLIDADNESATVGSALSYIERELARFVVNRGKKPLTAAKAAELSVYTWDFIHNMLFQYLSHPSVASAMKVVRVLRMYIRAPERMSVDDRTRAALLFRAGEYVHYAVQKALERLVEVGNSEIEICHFLSLARACDVEIDSKSRLAKSLIRQIEQGLESVPSPKGNQAPVLLLLSLMKYFMSWDGCDAEYRARLIDLALGVSEVVLDPSYLPRSNVKRHAIQEVFILAIASCPFLDPEERLKILAQAWLLGEIQLLIFAGKATPKASKRFLRRCLHELTSASGENSGTWPEIFSWSGSNFDEQLFEKQPQFLY
ncbi:RNA-directed DNA polymerase [Arthrobacter sp.]|uniref:RNA-directed DNA polymerase n=1 Tax=Arthrobacter sp. TaxID=1667 RepID=UPI003A914BC7